MALPKLYSVASTPGLFRTTTRHTPSSIYYGRVQIMPKGAKRKRSFSRTLGAFPSAEAAAEVLRAFRKEIKARSGCADGATPGATIRTLVDAQRAQLTERSPRLKASTIKNYQRENRNAQKFFGRRTVLKSFNPETEMEVELELRDCPLRELTRARIEEWIRYRLDVCAPATMNRDLARLRAVMRWAEREGWLKWGNPINQVSQLPETEGVIRWLDDIEEARLKEASPPWLWRMIEFSFWTGLRRGEQLGLRWDQIRDGLIEVRATQTKGKRSRWIPITETIQEILDAQRADPQAHPVWVFPNLKGRNRWNPFNFFKKWDAARTVAGLKDYRWHDNRHTFCSRLVQEGVPLEHIQILAGHKDIKMTQRYAHLAPTHLRAPMNALEERKRRQLLQMAGAHPELREEQPRGASRPSETPENKPS